MCHGNGFIPEHQCPMCHGQGRINENVPFEMDIGRGIKDGFIFKKKHGNVCYDDDGLYIAITANSIED